MNLKLRFRSKWYSRMPDEPLELESGDMVILNLIENHDTDAVNRTRQIVEYFGENKGILVVISAPMLTIASREVTNYYFLPWPKNLVSSIKTFDELHVEEADGTPRWVKSFVSRFKRILIAPATFLSLPPGSHMLMQGRGIYAISVSYKYKEGRILILPSILPIVHGETDPSSIEEVKQFLEFISANILPQFGEINQPPPEWLDYLLIRDNEEELREQYTSLGNRLEQLYQEKSILADDGHSLTRRVSLLLEQLGFKTLDVEVKGQQDIEIFDDDFKGLVECKGSTGNFGIKKLRQLIEYLATEGDAKGFFICNPWKNKHPLERNLSDTFTEDAVKRATKLSICLVTVPHLYRALLDCKSDKDKENVRKSLIECVGVWQYPVSEWT